MFAMNSHPPSLLAADTAGAHPSSNVIDCQLNYQRAKLIINSGRRARFITISKRIAQNARKLDKWVKDFYEQLIIFNFVCFLEVIL